MCEDFFLSDYKIKKICPYCNSCKVELIKKSKPIESFTSMLSLNNEDQWGVFKRSQLILRCINCQRVFKFSELFTFTPFTEDDLKDEKDYMLDYLNDLSLNKIINILNQTILLLNKDPFNKVIWEKLELIFRKLKNDNLKINIEKREEKANQKSSEIIFFSYYLCIAQLKAEKAQAILNAKYENASKLRDIEKQYVNWKSSVNSILFINKKHFYIKNKKTIIFKTSINPFLNPEIIKLIIGMMETSDIQNILYLQYFTD